MKYDTDKKFCSILLDVVAEHGVRDVVCSPGSRNAPLLIAASQRENLRKHVAVDERCAAFMALGMALVSQRPVALICTSGSALLNYSPAVAEAYYSGVPLIVISADRPEQWIDQDDSQTIRQFQVLRNFIKQSYELPAFGEEESELQWYANRIANEAMIEALSGKQGPVHINMRFSEPLGRKIEKDPIPQRIIREIKADSIGNKEILNQLSDELSHSKVMIVSGFMQPDSKMQRVITDISSLPNVVIMAETLSNLHLRDYSTSIDSVLTACDDEELDRHRPDIVISLGGALVSRKLKEYLRRNSLYVRHWALGNNNSLADCYMSMSLNIETEPVRFLRHVYGRMRKKHIDEGIKEYKQEWARMRVKALRSKDDYIESIEWSELKAFEIILKSLPQRMNLFLSNGTPVRYAQLINYSLPHASYCNRGVSGIDGCVSTAIGGAKMYKENTLLITGDLSMAYDIGSLALADIPNTMKIIVIDNQGGGIFRFIPSTSLLEEREEYFCASPNLPLKELCLGYGWKYIEANDFVSLKKGLNELFHSTEKSIMRIICDGEKSAKILKDYMKVKANSI